MTRRATATAPESSLDLLLDTICNTFGGVVFIAILVVIMVNLTSDSVTLTPPNKVAQSELIELVRSLQKPTEPAS